MNLSIPENKKSSIFNDLSSANHAFNKIYRGDREDRQPIHTVYGGANLFKSNTTQVLGEVALKSLLQYAPNFVEFAKAFQLNGSENFPSDNEAQTELINTLENLSEDGLKKHSAGFSYRIYKKVITKTKTRRC